MCQTEYDLCEYDCRDRSFEMLGYDDDNSYEYEWCMTFCEDNLMECEEDE